MAMVSAITRIRSPIFSSVRSNVLNCLLINRAESDTAISPSEIQTKSPYEELKVSIDFQSTKENPMKVNAYGDERTIACVCDDMHFMTLKKGPPVKCKCGYWFQLVDANKFWIEKQDS